jgi:hypothetical protein
VDMRDSSFNLPAHLLLDPLLHGNPCFQDEHVNTCQTLSYVTPGLRLFLCLSAAASGSWGCFDEFNRLVPEVLSVCSVQYKAVTDAQKRKSLLPGRCVLWSLLQWLQWLQRSLNEPGHQQHALRAVPIMSAGAWSTLTKLASSTSQWPHGALWLLMEWRCLWRRAPAASCEWVRRSARYHTAACRHVKPHWLHAPAVAFCSGPCGYTQPRLQPFVAWL